MSYHYPESDVLEAMALQLNLAAEELGIDLHALVKKAEQKTFDSTNDHAPSSTDMKTDVVTMLNQLLEIEKD